MEITQTTPATEPPKEEAKEAPKPKEADLPRASYTAPKPKPMAPPTASVIRAEPPKAPAAAAVPTSNAVAITSNDATAPAAPTIANAAKEARRAYRHAPPGAERPCGGGGRLSPPFAEKIRDNPQAFGALQCSVCGLRPVSRYTGDGTEEYHFVWEGTEDKVGVRYAD